MSPRDLFLISLFFPFTTKGTCFYGYTCINNTFIPTFNNTYHKEVGPNGEDIWKSDQMIPQPATAYGSIKLGQVMSAEFDFEFKGRTNTPRRRFFENFFRVGFSSIDSESCDGQGARYPSFWLSNDEPTMHVSVSSGDACYDPQSLSNYGNITVNVSYHILIRFNNTKTMVQITGGDKPNWNKTWNREPVYDGIFIGQYAHIWWMSDKNSGKAYNLGSGIFRNITFTSSVFQPTSQPTADPSQTPTAIPSSSPTTKAPSSNPSVTPTLIPSVSPITVAPSLLPTMNPTTTTTTTRTPTTNIPTSNPIITIAPSKHTTHPSIQPSHAPSAGPTAIIPTTHEPSISPSTNPSINPSSQPTTAPYKSPTTPIPTSTPSENPTHPPSINPSKAPTNNPTKTPSNLPTNQPSFTPTQLPSYGTISPSPKPSFSPTTKPTENPTIEPTKNPIKTSFVYIPNHTQTMTQNTEEKEQTHGFWNQNPYTYIFYSAIVFTALVLIMMAIGCYCKFKPPDLGVKYDYDVTSQSYVPHASHGQTVIHRTDKNEGNNAVKRHSDRAERVHVNTHSHHMLTESATIPSEDIMIGALQPRIRNETTGSQTSDEDVLKGAYGGHITAGAEMLDEPFPRDKLRTINDDHVISPQQQQNNNGYRNIIKPIDMQYGDSSDRGLDYTQTEDYYEEEYEDNVYDEEDNQTYNDYDEETELTDDDDDDDDSGYAGHHMTIGAPIDYMHNRHHVDGDEQAIVEMITKDELQRKMVTDMRRTKAEKDVQLQYTQNIYHHQQKDSQRMDDIIHDMNRDYGHNDEYGYD